MDWRAASAPEEEEHHHRLVLSLAILHLVDGNSLGREETFSAANVACCSEKVSRSIPSP